MRFSTVRMSSGGPPSAYAELILLDPWPGMSTQLSRGIDATAAAVRSGFNRAIMSTSLRATGVASVAASEPVVGSAERESVPTSRKVNDLALRRPGRRVERRRTRPGPA